MFTLYTTPLSANGRKVLAATHHLGLQPEVKLINVYKGEGRTPEFPQAGEEEARVGKEAAARTERMKQRTPRVDWAELLRRTFDFDVFKTQTAKIPSASRCIAGSSGSPGARRLRA